MTIIDESELRRRYAQLRDADRTRAPSFAQTYERARARRSWMATSRVRPLVIGGATAVVIAAAWLTHGRSFTPRAFTPAIATWRAPTDALLETPGSELLGAMPALGASVLDGIIPTPSERGS